MTKLWNNKTILDIGDYHIENNAWGTTDPLPPQFITGPPDDAITWGWYFCRVAMLLR